MGVFWTFDAHFLVRANRKTSWFLCRASTAVNLFAPRQDSKQIFFTAVSYHWVLFLTQSLWRGFVFPKMSEYSRNCWDYWFDWQQETKLAASQLGADGWKRWWSVITAQVYSEECNGWPLALVNSAHFAPGGEISSWSISHFDIWIVVEHFPQTPKNMEDRVDRSM